MASHSWCQITPLTQSYTMSSGILGPQMQMSPPRWPPQTAAARNVPSKSRRECLAGRDITTSYQPATDPNSTCSRGKNAVEDIDAPSWDTELTTVSSRILSDRSQIVRKCLFLNKSMLLWYFYNHRHWKCHAQWPRLIGLPAVYHQTCQVGVILLL